ncbi:hypothetical protein, partial [Streptomyces sp. wa22]|uniref:hypothetical protein n=1 Tax=Streptomyces sp. wa22 TaxID=1828244 RepID=UPI0021C7ABFB
MHGYGYPPEQQPTRRPSSATLVTLRVVFVALALLSCGILAWAAMLRLAVVTRTQRDWWLFGLVLALNVGLLVYLGMLPEEDEVLTDGQAVVTLTWMLVVFVGTVTYYLYTEIRHFGPYGGPQGVPYAGPYAGPYGGGHPGAPTFSASTSPNSHQSRCVRVTTASRSMAAQARIPQLSRASATKTTRSVTSVA